MRADGKHRGPLPPGTPGPWAHPVIRATERQPMTGTELREARKTLGMSAAGMAAFLGVSDGSTLRAIERRPTVPLAMQRIVRAMLSSPEARKALEDA
jgi:DNA-binding transcriptional regulator YiaG